MYSCKTYCLIVFIFSSLFSFAQEDDFTSQYVDARSYALYSNKSWDGLILLGDSALQKEIDYYYLRMRMGIALYEQKKYLLAKGHFEKAIEFNSFEDLPKEYLFYCYFFTEQYEESRVLARKFKIDLKNKLNYNKWKSVDLFSFDLGSKMTVSSEVPNASYANVALGHYVGNRVYLYHAYTYFHQGSSDWFWAINQNQYYVKASLALKNNWNLALSFHLIGRDLLSYPFVNNFAPKTVEPTSTKTSNYVSSFHLKKNFKKFEYSVGSTVLWLDSLYQFQHNVGATFFPLANKKVSIGVNCFAHTMDSYSQLHFAFSPFISFKPSSKFSVYSSYLYNTVNNIAEWNGALVNNAPDLTTGRFTLNSVIRLNDKWDLSATYQYEMKRSTFTSDYTFNSIFVGLKFKP